MGVQSLGRKAVSSRDFKNCTKHTLVVIVVVHGLYLPSCSSITSKWQLSHRAIFKWPPLFSINTVSSHKHHYFDVQGFRFFNLFSPYAPHLTSATLQIKYSLSLCKMRLFPLLNLKLQHVFQVPMPVPFQPLRSPDPPQWLGPQSPLFVPSLSLLSTPMIGRTSYIAIPDLWLTSSSGSSTTFVFLALPNSTLLLNCHRWWGLLYHKSQKQI